VAGSFRMKLIENGGGVELLTLAKEPFSLILLAKTFAEVFEVVATAINKPARPPKIARVTTLFINNNSGTSTHYPSCSSITEQSSL